MSRIDDFRRGNVLDYSYHQNCYKLIVIDLSRQTNKNIPQQICFQENQKNMIVQQCFLLLKSSTKTVLNFSLDSLNVMINASDQLNANYFVGNEIIYYIEVLTLSRIGGKQADPTSFFSLTSTNVGINPKTFSVLVLKLLLRWFKISRPYLVPVPIY